MINTYLQYLNESENKYPIMTFPKVEWDDVKEVLNSGKVNSTTRNSCGKNKIVFKVGQLYKTQWGDIVKVIKVQHFDDPKKIPTWDKMNKTMKNSIMYGIKMCGTENLQWVHVKKVLDVLYHGSHIQGMTKLDPKHNVSNVEGEMKSMFIYAGDSKSMVSAFTFPWIDPMGIQFGRINNGPYTMKIPRKHLHLLNNPCSIYEVSSQSFKPVFGGLKGEYRTTKIVKVLSEEKYKSAKDCMIKHGVKIKVIK